MLVLDNLIYRWQHSGGISTVWYELTKRIIGNCCNYYFIEYENSKEYNYLRKTEVIPTEKLRTINDRLFYIKKYLPLHVKEERPFVFHSSYYRNCTNKNAVNIITLHDFTYEYYRSGLSKFVHCKTKQRALKNADIIVCVSENTKKDLQKFVPEVDLNKVRIIYNGVSDSYYPMNMNTDDFLLFVGDRIGYKNFRFAAECAAKAGMKFVICGKKLTEEEKKFLNTVLPGRYEDKGFVSETELNTLYNRAFALIYPSSYEGFGIPVIEAQKAGCPVLAMNNSSLPEVIGDCNMLCNSLDVHEMLDKINSLKKKAARQYIIDRGKSKAAEFSWNKTFREYKSLYKELENTVQ